MRPCWRSALPSTQLLLAHVPQVKTRMQLQSKGTGTQYNGMVDCAWSQSGATELAGFRKIIAEEG